MSFVHLNDHEESQINTTALLLAPIERVDRDTLWFIFDLIASSGFSNQEIQYPFALVTIQHSSQVCHAWRTILLSSPSIWAKVIQMELLVYIGHRLRDEVMRRTGSAPLWIQARGDSGVDVLSKLICNNWDRIERLKLVDGFSDTMNEEVWLCYLRPAPLLEIFILKGSQAVSRLSQTIEHPIFSGNAPKLREFCLENKLRSRNLRFECHFGWMSRLRRLQICLSTSSMTSHFIIAAANMPLLRSLDIFLVRESGRALEKFSPGSVGFPSLKILELTAPSHPALLFLDIISQPDTFTRIQLSIRLQDYEIGEIGNTQKILSTHMASYLSANVVTEAVFYLACGGFRIGIQQTSYSSAPLPHVFSCRRSGRTGHDEPNHLISLSPLFSALPSQFAAHITSLGIRPMQTPCIVRHHLGDLVFANHFASYLRLETLTMPFLLLPLFSAMPTTIRAFPALRTLKTLPVASKDGDFERNVFAFLEWRKAVGVPIETLDLTHHSVSAYAAPNAPQADDAPSLESLEVEMAGMVIKSGPMQDPRLHRVSGKGSLKDLELSWLT